MITRFAAALVALSALHGAAVAAESPSDLVSRVVEQPRCNQGDDSVWPIVEAYARTKGLPPAATAMDSYRYLVLRILDTCMDGETLVLGDRDGDSKEPFRRLMAEFCDESQIKSDKAPGIDPIRYPSAARWTCTVTKINALKGFPTIHQPEQSNVVIYSLP